MYRQFSEQAASTNDLARAHAACGGELPALFVVAQQSAGRGRMGHSFLSERGGLYMSLALRPSAPASQSVRLTIAAAVAAAEVLEALTGYRVTLKWVNDLYMDGRKVGGILTEGSVLQDGSFAYAVIGIGINLAHIDFPPALATSATSVADVCGVTLEPNTLAERIAHRLLSLDLQQGELIERYRARCFVLGREVTVLREGGDYDALAVDLREDAALIVRRADGTEEALFFGDVRVKPIKSK